MKVSEFLKISRDRILNPARWTTGALARQYDKRPTSVTDPKAIAFCSIGTLEKTMLENHTTHQLFLDAYGVLQAAVPGTIVAYFNDNSNHADVIRAWDDAIQLAEQNESKLASHS